MPEIKPAQYDIPPQVRNTNGSDGGVVLDIRRNKVFRLNATGALIFEELKNGRNVNEVSLEISQKFNVAIDVANNDVNEFVAAMLTNRLIKFAELSR